MLEPSFEVLKRGDWYVLKVWGEVDMATAPKLRKNIITLTTNGATQVVLDLEGVEFLDSTGLGVLVGGVKRLRTAGGELRVVCTRRHLVELFEITRLTNVFELFDDLDKAVETPRTIAEAES